MQQIVIFTVKYITFDIYSTMVTEVHVQKHGALYSELRQLTAPPKLRKIESNLQALFSVHGFLFTSSECYLDSP